MIVLGFKSRALIDFVLVFLVCVSAEEGYRCMVGAEAAR